MISSIIYAAFGLLSAAVLNFVAGNGWLMGVGLLLIGGGLFVFGRKKKVVLVLSILTFVIGLFGLLQALGILSGVPVLAFGIPALLSCYFDLFSGFIQALVFTLLSMVYISGSLPGPEVSNQQ